MNTEEKIKALGDRWAARKRAEHAAWLDAFCESPIEKLLAAGFFDVGFRPATVSELMKRGSFAGVRADRRWLLPLLVYDREYDIGVRAQSSVRVSGRSFRVDFSILFPGGRIAVEADGHDFHERTKKQAAHDKARDRLFTENGWLVLRFAGSEIWRDASACASQVVRLAEKVLASSAPSLVGRPPSP